MGTYTGTTGSDTITPTTISAGVIGVPGGSKPSAAADTIDGAGGGDILSGGDGNDTIHDRPLYDANGFALSANAGNTIHGDGGNDKITIEIGDTGGANPVTNRAYGDDGNDTVALNIGDYDYVVDDDTEWVGTLPTGSVSLHGGAGDDRLDVVSYVLTPGMTVSLYGGAGADHLSPTMWVWEPDGSFSGGDNNDYLYGGAGDDRYSVLENKDAVIENPGEGTDTVDAVDMDYVLPANVENLFMTFYYYAWNDVYTGTGNSLNNVIRADDYAWDYTAYHLNGMAGDDVIHGATACNDSLDGGTGNDTLYGSQSPDGTDADVIRGGAGNDLIYGGSGNADRSDGNDLLYGDGGNDRIFGSFGDDLMYGGTGNDEMGGQAGNDTMHGGAGNDKLGGGSGNDNLYGEAGADLLTGREGLDQLSGGSGNDIFDYDAVTDSRPGAASRDVILDFVGVGRAVGDRIDLATIDADTTKGGNQAFSFIGTKPITGAGQVHVVKAGADTLVQANTGGTLAPELEILVRDGGALYSQWIGGDFIL